MYDGPTIANLVAVLYRRWMLSIKLERRLRKYIPGGRSSYNAGFTAGNKLAYYTLLEHLDLTDYYTHGNGD